MKRFGAVFLRSSSSYYSSIVLGRSSWRVNRFEDENEDEDENENENENENEDEDEDEP